MADTDVDLSQERFGFTVFLSLCLHAMIILGVGFTYLEETNSAPALEITLAQYRSEIAPDDADFLSQENQIGSGVLSEKAAPSSPFESDFNADVIQEILPIPQAPQIVNEIDTQDLAVISTIQDDDQIRQQLDEIKPEEEPVISEQTSSEQLSLAIASLQAQLDLQRQEYAKRPRKYTI